MTDPQTTAAAAAAPSLISEIHWLKRNPDVERMLRWVLPIAYSIALLTIALVGLLYFAFLRGAEATLPPAKLAKVAQIEAHLFGLALFSLGLPIIAHIAVRSARRGLGSDGRALYFRGDDGRPVRMRPEQLVHDGRQLSSGGRTFLLLTGRRVPLYDPGELETFVAPLLARARKLGPLPMLAYQLRHGEPQLIATLAFVAAFFLWFVESGAWRYLMQ